MSAVPSEGTGGSTYPTAVGIDVGGTNTKGLVADSTGRVLSEVVEQTSAAEGRERVTDLIGGCIRRLLQDAGLSLSEISGIGVGFPGELDWSLGIVRAAPNLPGWKGVPLRQQLRERFSTKICLDNDANAAALGEYLYGGGRSVQNMVLFTLGTGIGGGLVLGGRLFRGSRGMGGELGHMTVEPDGPTCGCGNAGCLEALAAAPSVIRRAREGLNRGVRSALGEAVGGRLELLDVSLVARTAREGDLFAKEILAEAGRYLGIGIANVINIFNPEMVVLGGGMVNAGDLILAPARAEARKRSLSGLFEQVEIRQATLGERAGRLGAAALVFHEEAAVVAGPDGGDAQGKTQ